MFRVLVTGSRNWQSAAQVWGTLDGLLDQHPDLTVMHGDAKRGADALARSWCERRRVPQRRVPAEWGKHGRRAGIIRNADMVRRGADLCVAFHRGSSPGTASCIDLARRAGIPTVVFVEESP